MAGSANDKNPLSYTLSSSESSPMALAQELARLHQELRNEVCSGHIIMNIKFEM